MYSDPTKVNTDGDKKADGSDFTDFDEFQATSDPNAEDTDGDAIPDGIEQPGGAWQVEGQDPEIA